MNKQKIVLILVFLLAISNVLAAAKKYKSIFDDDFFVTSNFSDRTSGLPVYNISVFCSGGVCMEGDTILFNITLNNKGTNYLEILALFLVDAATGQNITLYNASKLFADVNDELKIALNATLPKSDKPINLTYYPCIKISLSLKDTGTRYRYGLERTICNDQIFSTLVGECNTSLMCLTDENCVNYDCKKLDCGNCSYIANHSCYNYECCTPQDCAYNATCVNHACKEFNCKFYEHIENHECTVLYCDKDELYVDHTCVKLNCSYDEYYDNHRCRKLECTEDQILGNHSCIPLQCAFDEKAVNHTCQKLNCNDDEMIFNHSCQKLDCKVYQYSENHSCTLDMVFIKSFVKEFIVWLLIIVFLYLIEHIYKKRHPHGKENGII